MSGQFYLLCCLSAKIIYKVDSYGAEVTESLKQIANIYLTFSITFSPSVPMQRSSEKDGNTGEEEQAASPPKAKENRESAEVR